MIKLFNHHFKINKAIKLYTMGYFGLWLVTIIYIRFDGVEASFKWLIFDRGESVAVLLHRESDNKICLVEQFRPATLVSYGYFATIGGEMLEIIAGSLESGEKPIDCLHRETAEEAGRLVKNVRLVTDCFMSPGGTSEKISIYLADDDGSADLPGGGLKEENEDIRIHWVTLDEAKKMIKTGEIQDAKTIIAIQALLLEKI